MPTLSAASLAAILLGASLVTATPGRARPVPFDDSALVRRVDSLVAATPETAFNLGWVNKLCTQIVVRQLAAAQG